MQQQTAHEHGGAMNLQTLSTAELYLEGANADQARSHAQRQRSSYRNWL